MEACVMLVPARSIARVRGPCIRRRPRSNRCLTGTTRTICAACCGSATARRFTAGDGAGGGACAGLCGGALEAAGDRRRADDPEPAVTIGFALTKGDKPELVVQKLTELGVDRIVPVDAGRSVVRWDDAKAARNVERLRAVARAAAMQARRAWLPDVDDVATLGELAAGMPGLALAHPVASR